MLGLAVTAFTGALASGGVAQAASSSPQLVALTDSVSPTTDAITGGYSASQMQIEVALQPRDASGLASTLASLYNPDSSSYQHWLAAGQFDTSYAPATATQNAVASFLHAGGLTVDSSSSPFLVRATGTSAQVSAVLHTTLSTYKDSRGISYFANSTPVEMPSDVASDAIGVVGLTNTIREQDGVINVNNTLRPKAVAAKSSGGGLSGCETTYPTRQWLFESYVEGATLPFGYGGGPGCAGLTPSQTNSIYDAPNVGPRGKGAGTNVAVFELSAYQASDIETWTSTFYGPHYNPPLVNVTVDGGPLSPICPAGDTCPPQYEYYSGDIEVDADIEQELSISPDVRHLLVYNAPNDETGQTELDEYTTIAKQDTASSISSSWGLCENDAGAAYAQAENVIFEQMAAQGQSLFSSAGDTGAFDCIRSDGTTVVNVEDPASQPWVTSVGGASLESDNPGSNPHPSYPRGVESVWNTGDLCSNAPASPALDNQPGFFWCAATGAGGGGSSQYWGLPFYQRGPGIINKHTEYGNGSTNCSLAKQGTPCREVPDISADADEFTPYAEYCTGSTATPYSVCATIPAALENVPGWFGIGGTSLSSPLWAGIAADRDAYQGHRSGNFNPLVYLLYDWDAGAYFHDITGIGQSTNNNGLYPTTPGYDLATGIGTPKMAALITGS
jgi:kumamolisin